MDLQAAARAIDAFLRALDLDPASLPELSGTGERVARAYAEELLEGYGVDVDGLLAGSLIAGHTEVVVVRDLPVVTLCPHHLMPSSGTATVAYAPGACLAGVGAVARVVQAFARRLALQEQLGEQVVASLQKHLAPRWAACRIVLAHSCMIARGERSHGARVETVAIGGAGVDPAALQAALGAGR